MISDGWPRPRVGESFTWQYSRCQPQPEQGRRFHNIAIAKLDHRWQLLLSTNSYTERWQLRRFSVSQLRLNSLDRYKPARPPPPWIITPLLYKIPVMVPSLMTIQTKELILYIEAIASGGLHFKGSKPFFDYQICWVYLFTAIDLTARLIFRISLWTWSFHLVLDLPILGSYSLW